MKQPAEIQGCVDLYPAGLEIRLDRLRVKAPFLKELVDAIRQLRDELVEKDDSLQLPQPTGGKSHDSEQIGEIP
jgi:hypothetical protein